MEKKLAKSFVEISTTSKGKNRAKRYLQTCLSILKSFVPTHPCPKDRCEILRREAGWRFGLSPQRA
ncbi:MAG: hypothetical protein LBK18_03430 [Prevotellaceae bacterium]|jgi:hypothetical protein|nr:hypothetical protein [Prevotellaceae bacterium]